MDVSIIIVNYNTKKLTLDCINSIYKYTVDVKFEVILVDNASTDGSAALFKTDNRITFIQSGGNIGFGRANNLGYSKAIGKYIFLLNSDTVLLNNAIKIFWDKMELLPQNISCIGTILKGVDLEDIHSFGKFPTLSKELIYRTFSFALKKIGFELLYYDDPKIIMNTDFEVDYVTGADMFIRRTAIEECGMFDPQFFMYYEETDLQNRFSLAGYKQMIVYGPSIIHLFGASGVKTTKPTLSKRIGAMESSFIYLKKRYNKLNYILYRLLLIIFSCPIFLLGKFSWDDKKKYFNALTYFK